MHHCRWHLLESMPVILPTLHLQHVCSLSEYAAHDSTSGQTPSLSSCGVNLNSCTSLLEMAVMVNGPAGNNPADNNSGFGLALHGFGSTLTSSQPQHADALLQEWKQFSGRLVRRRSSNCHSSRYQPQFPSRPPPNQQTPPPPPSRPSTTCKEAEHAAALWRCACGWRKAATSSQL